MTAAALETIAVPLFSSATAASVRSSASLDSATLPAAAPDDSPSAAYMSVKDAVQNCRLAYSQALVVHSSPTANAFAARCKAVEAYCAALPYLTSEGNCRAFIACVTHAMAVEILRKSEGLQLITAARAALGGFGREPRPAGRPKNNFLHP